MQRPSCASLHGQDIAAQENLEEGSNLNGWEFIWGLPLILFYPENPGVQTVSCDSMSQSGKKTSCLIAKDKFQLSFLNIAFSLPPYSFPDVLQSAPSFLSGRAVQH